MQGPTTVTLLATERDSKKIELARNLGPLSLSLLGGEEIIGQSDSPDPVNLNDILGVREARQDVEASEPVNKGVLYSTDPSSGKQIRYVLPESGGSWRRDSKF